MSKERAQRRAEREAVAAREREQRARRQARRQKRAALVAPLAAPVRPRPQRAALAAPDRPDLRPEARPMTEPRLELLPAVDVAGGQAVRLVQGEAGSETDYGDPLEAALAWQKSGATWIHLVDLDAAFGRGSNRELLARVVST